MPNKRAASKVKINTWIEGVDYAKLKELARIKGTSMTEIVNALIDQHLAENEKATTDTNRRGEIPPIKSHSGEK